MHVGVDVGGTFTDLLVDDGSEVSVVKVPTTPDNPARGVVDGLRAVERETGRDAESIELLAHGTTVATNAVLEREWADTALVTTEGFRDILEIGRQERPALYDLHAVKPEPVVPRRRRYEVPERIDSSGRVGTELDGTRARAIGREIAASDVDAVAVCFLNAFVDGSHERRMAELLAETCPELSVTLSSDVLPEIREYERTVTTVMSAALQPVIDDYLSTLETEIEALGADVPVNVMQSNGGVVTAATARTKAVNTLLSGPAAGVLGAANVGSTAGFETLLTLDMGGTSTDVSLVTDGTPLVSPELEVDDHPIRVPMVDVHTVGNGGGSVAWLDDGGALRVGPESAGADPGPICYGRGGERFTVTDAHAFLGRIDPDVLVSDDGEDTESALADGIESLCDASGQPPETVAQDILDVANANLKRALRVVSTERGHDPREFTLVAFGGAGPLHAGALLDVLDVSRVIVPARAGVLSAHGLLVSDLVYDHTRTLLSPVDTVDPETVEQTFRRMEATGDDQLRAAGVSPENRRFVRKADARYDGQSYELTVRVGRRESGKVTRQTLDTLEERFHEAHEQRYGHVSPAEPVELVTLRLDAVGESETRATESTLDSTTTRSETTLSAAQRERRAVTFGDDTYQTSVYDRPRLPLGESLTGPAIVEGRDTTVVVYPEQHGQIDEHGTIHLVDGGDV